MIPVKIQCACGQRYSFDAEPVDGHMASAIACPVCGADGTAAANEIITRTLAEHLEGQPAAGARLRMVPWTAPAPHQVAPSHLPGLPTNVVRPPAKLAWYDQIWIALPFALVAVGGAIGGACGGAAWAINRTVFKQTRIPVLRYVWTGVISAAAVVVWIFSAAFILSLIKKL
jgi:hypothetical protein